MTPPVATPAGETRSAGHAQARPRPGPTRVAVVGAGYIADYHFEVLARLAEVELVAACDLDLERARRAVRVHGLPHAVASPAELRQHGVQVAHVVVPPDRHARVARELLELGIGAFVEKPVALEAAEARALGALARERGLPFGVNHNACFHPAFARLERDLAAGRIGRLEHVQATLAMPLRQLDAGDFTHWMFREPRNVVFEQAPHPFSQVHRLTGELRELHSQVLATRELLPGQAFHERWSLAGRGERATFEVHLAFGTSFPRSTLQVLGTDGMLEADLHHDLFARETKTQWLDFWNSFLAGWRRGGMLRRDALANLALYLRLTLGLGERRDAFWIGMRDSIAAFHRAVAAGREPPVGAEAGAAVVEWCERAAAPAASAAPVAPVAPVAQGRAPEPSSGESGPEEPGPPRPGEVVVLGASGFIGRRTVERLVARGVPVTAVGRRRHGLPPEVADPARDGRVRLLRARLEDDASLAEAVRGARVVLHLATGGGDDWETVERAMVRGSRRVAEACAAEGVERLVYVSSTAALYLGRDRGSEVVADDEGPDPRPAGRALYARGKIAAELALRTVARERGLALTIARPAVVVGPGTPLQHSGIGLWVRDNHCVGWGTGRRPLPLVLVDDVAEALARAALHAGSELDGKALNLAARTPLGAADVVAAYRVATGRDFRFHPRPLWLSQALEVGKWLVKRVGGRRVAFPSYRDLKTRELWPALECRTARDVLGWRPCEEPRELLRRMLAGAVRATGGAGAERGPAPERSAPPQTGS